MKEILDRQRLEVFIDEVFWTTIPAAKGVPFRGDLVADLGLDSLDILDLASEFHFRFDMLSGSKDWYLLQYKTAEDWTTQLYQAANDVSRRFGFFSSGSTGQPKQVWHSKAQLLQECDFWLQFTEAKGVVCLAPVRHIYGFIWGLLLGTKLKNSQYLSVNQWHELKERASDSDVVVGHPAAWQQVSAPFPHRLAINSTTPLDKQLQETLCATQVKGVNVYGSTETGALAWQSWEEPHYQLLPFWKKYKEGLLRDGKFYEIPDYLEWVTQEKFKVIGRKDQVIQIGGENVSLIQAQRQLEKIPGVAAVRVKPYEETWGTRLYCYFQLKKDQVQEEFIAALPEQLKMLPSKYKPRKWEVGHQPFNKLQE